MTDKPKTERTTRTIDLTPSPSGAFAMYHKFLVGCAAELRSGHRLTAERRAAIERQISYVAFELAKWPPFLEGVTWDDLEAMHDRIDGRP